MKQAWLVVVLVYLVVGSLGGVVVDVDGSKIFDETIPNAWENVIEWNYQNIGSWPDNWAKNTYPFLNNVVYFTGTGGCYASYPGCTNNDRDLFVDPSDPTKGYNFSVLITAIKNTVNIGLKPYIVTGNVPIAFSLTPAIGGFGVNTSPPSNYTRYFEYIAALAEELVSIFGIDDVRTWQWGVFTEYNNQEWLVGGPDVFFEIYDYTVGALQSVLGENQFQIGAHACTQCVNSENWDPLLFIDHVANGTNNFTGKIGTQINFVSNSFYELAPGQPGTLSTFLATFNSITQRAAANGLTNLRFGIDEGRLLQDDQGVQLASRAIGQTYQASFDALLFDLMVQSGVSWYSRWSVNSNDFAPGGVDCVATNLARLTSRMIGSELVSTNISGSPTFASDMVGAVSAYDSSNKTLRILIYNHNPDYTSTASEQITLNLLNVEGGQINGKAWMIDDSHAQYWPLWWKIQAELPDTAFSGGQWSRFSDCAAALLSHTDADLFTNNLQTFQNLSLLVPQAISLASPQGFSLQLENHGVVLLELEVDLN